MLEWWVDGWFVLHTVVYVQLGQRYAHHRHLSSSSLGILPDAAVSLTVGGHMASHILFFSAAPESVPGVASG